MSDTKKIGARIVLDGEAEFRQAINNSKSALKQFDSELKLTATQFKDNEKSMEALERVQSSYAKKQETLRKQEALYSEQLEKANKAHTKAMEVHEETAKSVETLKKKLEDAKRIYGEDSEEVQKLSKELEKSEETYAKQEKAITGLETKMAKWETGLNETRTELVEVDKSLEEVNHNIEHYDDYIKDATQDTEKASPELEKLSLSMGKLVVADLIADGIREMARACVDLAKASLDVGMSFEKSMSNVEALSGASGESLEALREKAREMGAQTMYSATEAADAFGYMALAGWDAHQMLTGITPILSLAAAADMDLAEASDIVTDYLTAFGLEAEDAAHFSDVLATAMSTSNTTVTMLGEAYKHCASTAHSMGIEVEDVTAVLATMANAGVKSGEAGTALNAIMTRLATNTKHSADVLHEYGVEVYDSEGNMNSLSSILEGLSQIWSGLTDKEEANLAKIIAGTNQYSKFQTIMQGVSDAAIEGGMSFYDYAEALRDCDGSAKDMAETMQNNLSGKITILQSALEALGESVYDVFDDDLKNGVEGATNAVTRFNDAVKNGDLNASLNKMSKSLGQLIDKVVDWSEEHLPSIIEGLSEIIDNADKIVGAVEGIVAGLIAFRVASSAIELASAAMAIYRAACEGATIAQIAMNVAADANPYILLASVLVGLATATAVWISTQEDAEHALDGQADKMHHLADTYSTVAESIRKYADDNRKYVKSLSSEQGYVESLVSELDALSNKSGQSATDQSRMTEIVNELNTKFGDLNLTLEDHNGQLVVSNENWKDLINTQMKEAQVAAVQERLTTAYEKKYDAELNLYDAQKSLNEVEEEYGDRLRELEALYSSDASQKNIDRMHQLEEELGPVIEEYGELKQSVQEAQEAVDEAGDSLNTINGFLEETEGASEKAKNGYDQTAEGITSIGDSAEYTAGQLAVMTEEFQKQVADMQESVQKTLESSNDIFGKTTEVEKQNIDTMKSNIDSHVEQLKHWGDSYTELSGRVNDETGLVLSYIANMGIEGQGYIDEMLTLDPEKLQAFTDSMVEALTLPEELASEAVDSYQLAVQNAIDGMVETFGASAEEGSELKTVEQEVAESLQEELNTALGENGELVGEKAERAITAMGTGIKNKTPEVKAAAQNVAKAASEPIETELTYGKFQNIGLMIAQGLAQGMLDGMAAVRTAAQQLAGAAINSTTSTLGIHSPSRVFKEIGDNVGKGFEIGIKESMTEAVKVLNNTLPNETNVDLSGFSNVNFTNKNNIGQLTELLTQMIPRMAESSETNVNVVLEGDAEGIFRVVQEENTRIVKSTGFKPLYEV